MRVLSADRAISRPSLIAVVRLTLATMHYVLKERSRLALIQILATTRPFQQSLMESAVFDELHSGRYLVVGAQPEPVRPLHQCFLITARAGLSVGLTHLPEQKDPFVRKLAPSVVIGIDGRPVVICDIPYFLKGCSVLRAEVSLEFAKAREQDFPAPAAPRRAWATVKCDPRVLDHAFVQMTKVQAIQRVARKMVHLAVARKLKSGAAYERQLQAMFKEEVRYFNICEFTKPEEVHISFGKPEEDYSTFFFWVDIDKFWKPLTPDFGSPAMCVCTSADHDPACVERMANFAIKDLSESKFLGLSRLEGVEDVGIRKSEAEPYYFLYAVVHSAPEIDEEWMRPPPREPRPQPKPKARQRREKPRSGKDPAAATGTPASKLNPAHTPTIDLTTDDVGPWIQVGKDGRARLPPPKFQGPKDPEVPSASSEKTQGDSAADAIPDTVDPPPEEKPLIETRKPESPQVPEQSGEVTQVFHIQATQHCPVVTDMPNYPFLTFQDYTYHMDGTVSASLDPDEFDDTRYATFQKFCMFRSQACDFVTNNCLSCFTVVSNLHAYWHASRDDLCDVMRLACCCSMCTSGCIRSFITATFGPDTQRIHYRIRIGDLVFNIPVFV